MDNSQPAFLHLRSQMLNSAVQECFDILTPYFPVSYNAFPAIVDLETGYRQGGTALCNYNMLQEEALSVADTLEEIGCGCLFVVPVPCSGLFAEEYLGTGQGSTQHAARVSLQVRAAFVPGNQHIKFPPYFSLHMIGAPNKPECRAQYRQIAVQNLCVRKPTVVARTEKDALNIISKFTLTR